MSRALPPVSRIRTLWFAAIACGVVAFGLALLWAASPGGPGLDWIWVVALFGAAVAVYSVAFFAFCSVWASSLSDMVRDDTKVEGDDVVHVVEHAETGDETMDFFVRAYATARGVSAVTIVSGIMIAGALTFF